jgi:hypothetical protein
MKIEIIALPLVVLVHSNDIHNTSAMVYAAFETLAFPSNDCIRLTALEEFTDPIPVKY